MAEVSPKGGHGQRHRPWQPGESGNPAGRPPGTRARDLARAHTDEAINTLVAALKNPRERVSAAVALLDRGWGKPRQEVEAVNYNVEVPGGIDAPELPRTLDEWLARRRSQLDQLN